jgi:hypothetical protein
VGDKGLREGGLERGGCGRESWGGWRKERKKREGRREKQSGHQRAMVKS